jgi:hypothetical protein
LSLQRDYANQKDANCIEVLTESGELAGHVEAVKARLFCWIFQEESLAIAATVKGKDDSYGVEITVTVAGKASTSMELQQRVQSLLL